MPLSTILKILSFIGRENSRNTQRVKLRLELWFSTFLTTIFQLYCTWRKPWTWCKLKGDRKRFFVSVFLISLWSLYQNKTENGIPIWKILNMYPYPPVKVWSQRTTNFITKTVPTPHHERGPLWSWSYGMGVGFTSAYSHWCCGFASHSGLGVQHYVIKFVSDLRQVIGFLRVLRFPPPIKLTTTI